MNDINFAREKLNAENQDIHCEILHLFAYNYCPTHEQVLGLGDKIDRLHKIDFALDVLNDLL